MATTAIWDVRTHLKRVLDYASNPNKTEKINDEDYHYNGLGQVISYTTNDLKTEKQLYVTGINCSLSSACHDMQITKDAFGKTDGILAYHGYQSFQPGEVDAEVAHQIGIELAQKMWGEHFEVLVSTHLDKNHYHNHFVVNSVSFVDGKRYYDNKYNYKRLRKLSDELCRKYHLSVIDKPQNKSMHYAQWMAENEHKPSWRTIIREDVDYAISQSMTMKQFYRQLENLGYELKFGKHIAVRPPDKQRFVRLKSLSNDDSYTEEAIKDKILEQSIVRLESIHKPEKLKTYHYQGDIKKAKKITGLRALYFHYLYRMGILPKNAPNKQRVHFLLKEELRYIDRITQETTLLCQKHINTIDELDEHCETAQHHLDECIKERRCLYNKIRRCRSSERKELLQKDIAKLSAEIIQLRKEVMLYEGIRERSQKMKHHLEMINNEERKEREHDERRWRNSRSSSQNDTTRN